MVQLFLSLLFIASVSEASKAPPSFVGVTGKKAIFIDIQNAHYHLDFDTIAKKAIVRSTLNFITTEAGYPLFDSVQAPTKSILNGNPVTVTAAKAPNRTTTYRMIDAEVAAGTHTVELETPLVYGVKFTATGAHSGFFMSDLDDRQFLELYMPSNLEYDQFEIMFHVKIIGSENPQDFFTNGNVSALSSTEWVVRFPSYFTTSSVFFHTAPKGAFNILSEKFKSVDGREIPVTVYGTADKDLSSFMKKATSVFNELEKDYGPWLHPTLVVYAGEIDGGMEHCGSTITNLRALGHEMTHSYFARGFMPANGDSGWMDEAIASWRDKGYPRNETISPMGTNMGNRSAYRRTTDTRAYNAGANFIGHLDFLSAKNGGLKTFLAGLVKNHAFEPFYTQEFQGELESFNGKSLNNEFQHIIYGGKGIQPSEKLERNPYHPRLTLRQLEQLL